MAKIPTSVSTVAGYVTDIAVAQIPRIAGPVLSRGIARIMDLAIDGFGRFPSAKLLAGKSLAKKKDVGKAIDSLIKGHIAAATSQGFVTNIGGAISTIIGTPVNATAIIFIQIRMAACIAHLHGYDVADPRVRTALAMCLLGERELNRQIRSKKLPSTPLAVATSPVYDADLYAVVTNRVLSDVLNGSTSKGLIDLVARSIPLAGGVVGGATDSYDTVMVSRCVKKNLVPRRLLMPSSPMQGWPVYPG